MLAGLTNVTFEFGSRALMHDATWHIQPGERIGLIGYNGTGKSTILKLLTGEYSPSAGTVEKSKTTSIGYLHQDLLSFDTNDSILDVALSAFEKVQQLEKEIEVLGKAVHPLPVDPIGRLESNIDTRLNHRALDMRNQKTASIFKLRHQVLQSLRKTLSEKKFIEIKYVKF